METKQNEVISLNKAQDVVFNLSKKIMDSKEENKKAFSILEIYKARCESQEAAIVELKQKLAKAEHDRDRYRARIYKQDGALNYIKQVKSELKEGDFYGGDIVKAILENIIKRAR